MIRPYLTVLKDSFHEAFASRVLWILLGALTLLLLAIMPLGLSEQRASRLRLSSIRDWPGLLQQIKSQSEEEEPSPGKHLWGLASDDFKKAVDRSLADDEKEKVSRNDVSKLLDELNDLLANREFYDERSWQGIEVGKEATDLLREGPENLSKTDLKFVNRQLLKSAFPAELANTPDQELRISYLGAPLGVPLPINRQMAKPVINQILGSVMGFFVGTISVFVAILVTASMIPHTFEAGAVDLLLSKPVSRPLLFLVKFLGGCAFILLNAGYFIVGLWLIMGIRFGLWNNSLLLCVPVFLFLFLIYYSVSAFAGVLWKNPVVAIVVTILFWAACFTVGAAKWFVEDFFLDPIRIVRLVEADDTLVAVNQSGRFLEWQKDDWEKVLDSAGGEGGPPFARGLLIGPVYDPATKQLTYVQTPPRARPFSFIPQNPSLVSARWKDGSWKKEPGPTPPRSTSWLFVSPQQETIVVDSEEVARLATEQERKKGGSKVFGIKLPFGGNRSYVALGPEKSLDLTPPFAAALDPSTGDIAVFNKNELMYLQREDGQYQKVRQRKFPQSSGSAALAFSNGRILVALSEGEVHLVSTSDLKTSNRSRPAGKAEPYVATATPNGKHFAVLFHNGKLALFDQTGAKHKTMGNDISAVAFAGNDQLLVADLATRVRRYELDSLRVNQKYAPRMDVGHRIYCYLIHPFYTIFPKPGELGNVVNYLLTKNQTTPTGGPMASDLRRQRENLNIAGPIWSSLAFVAVMLSLTCIYIQRTDI